MLTIHLNNGDVIDIPDFKEIKYTHNTKRVITADNLDNLYLSNSVTYLFSGKTKLIVDGLEIKYLEFK